MLGGSVLLLLWASMGSPQRHIVTPNVGGSEVALVQNAKVTEAQAARDAILAAQG